MRRRGGTDGAQHVGGLLMGPTEGTAPITTTANATDQTRAPSRRPEAEDATEPDDMVLPVAVVAVHVPLGSADPLNQVVLADAEIGPVTVRVGLFSMKRGRIVVRPPEAADRSEGVSPPPPLQEAVADAVPAAVEVDPEARAVLARWRVNGRVVGEVLHS